jgi:hypothetical protein
MDQLTGSPIAMLMITGVYLLVCGGFGAYAAHQKGRSRVEGFVFGLFLGPIGVVAVGTMPTLGRTTPMAEIVDEEGEEIDRRIAERFQPRPPK